MSFCVFFAKDKTKKQNTNKIIKNVCVRKISPIKRTAFIFGKVCRWKLWWNFLQKIGGTRHDFQRKFLRTLGEEQGSAQWFVEKSSWLTKEKPLNEFNRWPNAMDEQRDLKRLLIKGTKDRCEGNSFRRAMSCGVRADLEPPINRAMIQRWVDAATATAAASFDD